MTNLQIAVAKIEKAAQAANQRGIDSADPAENDNGHQECLEILRGIKEPPDELRLVKLDSSRDYLTYRLGPAGSCELTDIAVYTQRRQGKGRALVQKMLAELPPETVSVYVFCRRTNLNATAFYAALGFTLAGTLWDFYYDESGLDSALIWYRKVKP